MKGQQPHRQTNPKKLPALFPFGATLNAIKVIDLPGVPRFLMLGMSHAGRNKIYAIPPGAFWQLATPDMSVKQAERLEQKQGAGFMEGSALTLKAPGYRPSTVNIRVVRMLRETLEALEQYESTPLALGNESVTGRRSA